MCKQSMLYDRSLVSRQGTALSRQRNGENALCAHTLLRKNVVQSLLTDRVELVGTASSRPIRDRTKGHDPIAETGHLALCLSRTCLASLSLSLSGCA